MTITVTSVNVNGIRAATRVRSAENPGFLAWLESTNADLCVCRKWRHPCTNLRMP
ncbi:MAG: hypothetical protein U1U88_001915 [Lawsonella clevelandensis]